MLHDLPIFDIDTHYAEQPDLWTSRAPAKYRDKVMHVKRKANNSDAWFIGDREIGMIGPSVIAKDMSKKHLTFTLPTFDEMALASTYPQERLEYMDTIGVGAQVIYPNIIGFGAQTLMRIAPEDTDLRLFHVTAYNDALLDMHAKGKGRLLPQAALPLWDIDASLVELERVRKLGLTGIVMSDKPADFGQPSLVDPKWDRFFSACQDLDLPVNFHIASGTFEGDLSKFWDPDKTVFNPDGTIRGPISMFGSVNNFLNNMVDVMNILLTGLCDRYPRLKFVSVESGCGWMPFIVQAIEHMWSEMMSASDRVTFNFKREPREMFVDQVFASYFFEGPNLVDSFLKEFGNDNLMFQTDFPHPTSLYPGVKDKVQATLGHWDEETQRKVLYKNAERVYGTSVYGTARH